MNRAVLLLTCTLTLAGLPARAADKKIERLWKSKCQTCHGADGKADTEKGKKLKLGDLSAAAYQKKTTDADVRQAIVKGVSAEQDGVKKEMDAYDTLTPEQLDGLVAYVRELGR